MMKLSWIYQSLQAGVVASAVLSMLPAGAQTPATETPAAAPAAQSTPAAPRMQNRPQRVEQRAPRARPASKHHQRITGAGEPANADRLATDRGASAADYERNAMARCEAFKAPDERKACRERMRQTPQGSVQDGGLLWEYSYQVPAEGS